MIAKYHVAMRMTALLLPGLLYAMPAASEGDRDSRRSSDTLERSEQSKVLRAPVGHRQPTVADIPKNLPIDAAQAEYEKRERELDVKLRICRDC